MRCIFCKCDSTDSKSKEHIVPESLGNLSRILPVGIVCDSCNNNFARKVEKPVMDSDFVSVNRFTHIVPNKKGRMPVLQGILNRNIVVRARRSLDGDFFLEVPPEILQHLIKEPKDGHFILTTTGKGPDKKIFSRFLAKVAVEALAHKFLKGSLSLDEFIDDTQFDPIRNHARKGSPRDWIYHERKLYEAGTLHTYDNGENYVTLHEYDFLFTNVSRDQASTQDPVVSELYFIFTLFGIEYAINIGGPEVDGYEAWLKNNQ